MKVTYRRSGLERVTENHRASPPTYVRIGEGSYFHRHHKANKKRQKLYNRIKISLSLLFSTVPCLINLQSPQNLLVSTLSDILSVVVCGGLWRPDGIKESILNRKQLKFRFFMKLDLLSNICFSNTNLVFWTC